VLVTVRSVFVTNDFPPRIGGAQSYYWGAIQTLPPEDVVVVAPSHPDAARFDAGHPYRVVRLPSPVLWPTPSMLKTVASLVDEHGASLLQLGHPLPAGLIGPRLREKRDLPYVVFLGGGEVTLPGAIPGVASLLRHVLGGASMLLTVSEFTARAAARQAGGRVRAEVLRAPLPVGEYLPPAGDERVGLKARLGVAGPLVVCVGRLVPRKGQDMLIDALHELEPEFPDLELAIVGSGRYADDLRRRAQRRGVQGRVRMTGEIPHRRMVTWLRAADVFASPCRSRWGGLEVEGYGLVFAEAALCGLPVIAGRSGGAPEAVRPGESGMVVDGRSKDEIAGALATLLRLSPQGRETIGAAGRRLALARHSPAAVGVRYHDLLAEAAGRSPTVSPSAVRSASVTRPE
jgi:phosphatidylinositol alpha-1,6-mannosyltransferase